MIICPFCGFRGTPALELMETEKHSFCPNCREKIVSATFPQGLHEGNIPEVGL